MTKALSVLCTVLMVASCASWQPKTQFGKDVQAWWNDPATQAGVQKAAALGVQYAANVGLAAIEASLKGEPMTFKSVAIQGAIPTLYTQANYIRQLQGTAQVLDPIATAHLLERGGTSKEVSRQLALQLFENAAALIRVGLSPDQAAEVQAAGLDAAALKLATGEVK